jgi:hypothetical protein
MTRSEAARVASRARWGDHPAVAFRLDGLPPETRHLISLIVQAVKADAAREATGPADNGPVAAEGHGNDRSAA